MKFIGNKLKRLRKQSHYSQEYVASMLQMHRSNYSRIENDKQTISIDQIIDICNLFEVSADDFLDIKNSKSLDDETIHLITKYLLIIILTLNK